MEKPTSATYPLHPLIERRWSPRAFDERPVEPAKICSMLEAARWAPSCFNEQPWRFIVGSVDTTPLAHEKLRSVLVPGNAWAQKAPLLMLSVAKLNFTLNDQPNRHGFHDVGLAVENLVLQALHLGLATHQMAGILVDRAVEIFQIPSGYEPVAMIAIGYPGSPDSLEEPLRGRELAPRERKPLQEIVFANQWESVFPLCFT